MLAAVLPPGTRALTPHSSTCSDHDTDTTTICDQHTVRKPKLNPYSFWEFFDRVMVSGVLCPIRRNFSSYPEGVKSFYAGSLL